MRTRERVVAAFSQLLGDGSYADLSVTEVCRVAGVHRVTFYGHWPDLDSLATDVFAGMIDEMSVVPVRPTDSQLSPHEIAQDYAEAMRRILRVIAERREDYRTLLASPGGGIAARLVPVVQARAELMTSRLESRGLDTSGSGRFGAAFIAGGVVAAFTEWSQSNSVDVDAATAEILSQMPAWWPQPDL